MNLSGKDNGNTGETKRAGRQRPPHRIATPALAARTSSRQEAR
ncbi:hypothetical protein J2W32_005411 [Variovorax boronicumulans]|uniref:Uncharacterized protein n=1 Tax=Variovorax boronicumulans TaxID=436515 RepID=A0AAW8D1M1_9BURK|nr:hypothetical protein [Variovorax boronicumulans]MDP9896347.1 hypothetical protein [Variovorax boronicumulans]MDQ0056343.1 hypothetical protein [Variovorax boronicumulans]